MTITTELREQRLTISYDTVAKAAYIRLREGKVARTEEAGPGSINLDFNSQGDLIGVEIFGAALTKDLQSILKKLSKKHSAPALAHLHPSVLPRLYA